VVGIVSAFTLAHSITLSLAALGVIDLPSRPVESAIALSVLLAALNNIWPYVSRRSWIIAFAFGLVHGLGFASALKELGLPRESLALSLIGFNGGVELGQLAIVAVVVPIAFAQRRSVYYRRGVLLAGSWLIAAIAAIWLIERLFDLRILPVGR
jgi:HupE / UreJ protein